MPEPAPIELELRTLLGHLCGKDLATLPVDADIAAELGLDSLGALRLLASVEKRFAVRFPDQHLGDFRTLRQLRDFILEQP
jgi:acyl carrier protein